MILITLQSTERMFFVMIWMFTIGITEGCFEAEIKTTAWPKPRLLIRFKSKHYRFAPALPRLCSRSVLLEKGYLCSILQCVLPLQNVFCYHS